MKQGKTVNKKDWLTIVDNNKLHDGLRSDRANNK